MSIPGLLLFATNSLDIKFLSSLNLIVLLSIFTLKDLTFTSNHGAKKFSVFTFTGEILHGKLYFLRSVGSLVFFSSFQMNMLPSILTLINFLKCFSPSCSCFKNYCANFSGKMFLVMVLETQSDTSKFVLWPLITVSSFSTISAIL